MKPTKETTIAINTIATLVVATSVVMAATFILFYYLDSSTGIKDAWSTIAGFFGGFSTLTAAYIASKLFNDWTKNAAYNRNEKVINEFWDYYIESKINLVSLQDLLQRNSYHNNVLKITELFDLINDKLTRLYFYQQKLEIMLEIKIDDNIFFELEDIIKQYIIILDANNFNLQLFLIEDQKLINKLNELQPKLLKYLKKLNEKNLN